MAGDEKLKVGEAANAIGRGQFCFPCVGGMSSLVTG